MTQKLFTKRFGDLEVEHGGWQQGNMHIVRLTNGAYCFSSGLPVEKKNDFVKAGMKDEDLRAAHHWFEHRHDTDAAPVRGIKFEPDGTPVYDDGAPVESPSALMQYFQPGPMLDAAIKALVLKQEGAANQAQANTEKVAQEKERTKPGPKKKGGTPAPKTGFKPPQLNEAPALL